MANTPSPFLFAACQTGVEWALKDEVARRWPQLRFAFSRPGFVTFKNAEVASPGKSNPLVGSVFARTCGWSLGHVKGDSDGDLITRVWDTLRDVPAAAHIHVWKRDAAVPGDNGFAPGPTEQETQLGHRIAAECPHDLKLSVNEIARPNDTVFDCVIVEPDQWWLGMHHVESVGQRWPGGVPKLSIPDEMISRAYLKVCEALSWSRLPAISGDAFVEIGCAPGGSAQALLDRGFSVTGIDPADVDPRLRDRPGFAHIRKRGADLRRVEYRPFRWLIADLNVAPSYTLDTVEDIITHKDVKVEGMLLTLKLMDRPLYSKVGEYLERVRSWGYEEVRARQLAFNRQELCLAALRKKSLRRLKK